MSRCGTSVGDVAQGRAKYKPASQAPSLLTHPWMPNMAAQEPTTAPCAGQSRFVLLQLHLHLSAIRSPQKRLNAISWEKAVGPLPSSRRHCPRHSCSGSRSGVQLLRLCMCSTGSAAPQRYSSPRSRQRDHHDDGDSANQKLREPPFLQVSPEPQQAKDLTRRAWPEVAVLEEGHCKDETQAPSFSNFNSRVPRFGKLKPS
ncbi:hypothetical protein IWX90DRAFT_298884 [Phyllosticta citrichinensis]|uniref:Uncharacterized protein n=1 Tax=Phyllosticta citrichinensis TaxID=1130410 RepID=A0ABR1XL57_9PEZI